MQKTALGAVPCLIVPTVQSTAGRYRLLAQTLRIMKLISFIMLIACISAHASGNAQTVTLSGKNLSLREIFTAIKKQTGYVVFFKTGTLSGSQPVSLSTQNMPLTEFLDRALADQPISYVILGKTVHLSRKTPALTAGQPEALFPALRVIASPPVKGRITDSTGAPLSGATVSIRGKNRSTTTDSEGRFTLEAEAGDKLIVSYVGHETKEITVTASILSSANNLVITLITSVVKMEDVEVVNTGYQRTPKYQLTGAASTISHKDYDQRVAITGNFLESLEGKLPGLVYNSQSGELSVRGVSTFDAVKQPLIVLDGFPTEIDIMSINPNDIVSVTVLRDAAAASIYGVRASNGVIVIETKRGKKGKPVFNFRASYGFQPKPDFSYLKLANASEFTLLEAEQLRINNPSTSLYNALGWPMTPVHVVHAALKAGQITQEQANQKLDSLGSYDNLNEYESLFYQNRTTRNIDFDISGGSEKNTYLLGINYVGEELVNRRSDNDRFILNFANTYKFNERFNFDFRGVYTNATSKSGNTPGYNDFLNYEHLTDENGKPLAVALGPGRIFDNTVVNEAKNKRLLANGLYDQRYYPYQELTANTNTQKISSVRFQGRFNAKITSWLNAEIGGAYENQSGTLDFLQTDDAFNVRVIINNKALKSTSGAPLFTNLPQGDILSRTNTKRTHYTIRGQLNFNYYSANHLHNVSGIAGIEQKKNAASATKASYFGYDGQSLISKPVNFQILNTTNFPNFADVALDPRGFKSSDYFNEVFDDRRFMSYYAQGTYVYLDKYVATGSFRIDQSNLFGVAKEYRNKPLWSAGLSWRIHKEDFMNDLSWIDDLKLRVSTGFNGNVPNSINGKFLVLATGLNTGFNTAQQYNEVLSPENQSLRWETTRNFNTGLDYSLFSNRLSGTIDWYYRKSTDVFGLFQGDPTAGFNQYNANTASIVNKGLELMVNSLNISNRKFAWRTQVTASFNHNEVVKVVNVNYPYSQNIASTGLIRNGYPMGALFSYHYGGLNDAGLPTVLDRTGKKIVLKYSSPVADVTIEDLIYNGTTTPRHVLGLNNQFTIGSFDLSFLFMYYGGHVMRVEQANPNTQNPLEGSINYWRAAGDENKTSIPAIVGAASSNALLGYVYASDFVRKADYIRLRDIVLTYNLDMAFLEKAGLQRTQIRLQAQNAFRFTFSGNDIDPEAINRISGRRTLEQQPFYSFSLYTNF